MQRVLSTTVLLGLLIATAAAFAITERLKLVKSPIYGTHVSKTISPTCGCARGKAHISFKLRHADVVTLKILDARRQVVATLANGERLRRGRVSWTWRGRNDLGGRVPDGAYRPEVHLANDHRTILLPNPIRVDSHPPRVVAVSVSRPVISPDGDKVGDVIRIHYRFDSPAHVNVFLEGDRIIHSRSHQEQGTVSFLGKDPTTGAPLPAGTYTLWVGGTDLAGNSTPAAERQPVIVRVRYIALPAGPIRVGRPNARFTVRVDTDAPRFWWKLAGKRGVGSGGVLHLRAPKKPGTYTLAVGERRWGARVRLIVGTAK